MEYTQLANLRVSRFILGSNPFSGFSHQGKERDNEMVSYYSSSKIKEVWRQAENLGITTCIARTDHHIMRLFTEYWNEGGKLQWIAQVDNSIKGSLEEGLKYALETGAKGCFIHGGIMDFYFAGKQLEKILPVIEKTREAGLPAGVAGHNPAVFEWAEENLCADFYMCSYHNPLERRNSPSYVPGVSEKYHDDDRDAMVRTIGSLKKPAIHYKILAAGRKKPEEAFSFAAKHMRPFDALCAGVFTKGHPGMLEEDVKLFLKYARH